MVSLLESDSAASRPHEHGMSDRGCSSYFHTSQEATLSDARRGKHNILAASQFPGQELMVQAITPAARYQRSFFLCVARPDLCPHPSAQTP
jgi:hypothetical protein